MIRLLAAIAAAFALTGCESIGRYLENRVACTAAGDRAMVVSMWGPIGVASDVRPSDAARVCPPR